MDNEAVSFLPHAWYETLAKGRTGWEGCENWFSGLPLIAWFKLIPGASRGQGWLWLYAEVGPLSDHKLRSGLISAIKEEASEARLNRIAFQSNSCAEGKRASKFFNTNKKSIKNIYDVEILEAAMKALLCEFEKEFQAVERAIPKWIQTFSVKAL